MSLLHLLGVDNDISFDGRGLDKIVDNQNKLVYNLFIK